MKNQAGIALIEALIAVAIFSIGALTMIALQANSISAQTDAQYRIEAANQINRIIGEINLGVARDTSGVVATSLATFNHNPGGANCNFFGGASVVPSVTAWSDAITDSDSTAYLPGMTAARQQILVDAGAFNRVTVTLCWQAPGDAVTRQHQVIAYIN